MASGHDSPSSLGAQRAHSEWSDAPVVVRVLGGLSVHRRGVPLRLGARALELVAVLALMPAEQPRSAVAARLRPGASPQSTAATVRQALWSLRRALGPDAVGVLSVSRTTVGLVEGGSLWVDLWEFERRLLEDALEAAWSLCGGELLEGQDVAWALAARTEHRVAVEGLLERLAERAEAAADWPAAVAWSRRLVAHDPLSESAGRALAARLARAGDRAAALSELAALGERLRQRLGVAPSQPARRLAEQLRRSGDTSPTVPATVAGAGSLSRTWRALGFGAQGAASRVLMSACVHRDDEPAGLELAPLARLAAAVRERASALSCTISLIDCERGALRDVAVCAVPGLPLNRDVGDYRLDANPVTTRCAHEGGVLDATLSLDSRRAERALGEPLRGRRLLVAAVGRARPALAVVGLLTPAGVTPDVRLLWELEGMAVLAPDAEDRHWPPERARVRDEAAALLHRLELAAAAQ